jgi:hypothetical protein
VLGREQQAEQEEVLGPVPETEESMEKGKLE